jgi:AbrB family looped-hinge helix DNA binding protein
METTRLSSKGQLVLPKSIREAHGWGPGTEFVIESTADGVRLRPRTPFPRTDLCAVYGSARYSGPGRSLAELDDAIATAVVKRQRRSSRAK